MAGRISLYVRLQKVTLYLSIKKRLRSFRRRFLYVCHISFSSSSSVCLANRPTGMLQPESFLPFRLPESGKDEIFPDQNRTFYQHAVTSQKLQLFLF